MCILKDMSVNLSINGIIIVVPLDTIISSKLIKGLLDDINHGNGNDNNLHNIVIPIPDKYQSVFDNYNSVLRGDNPYISNFTTLLDCLFFANYLEDNNYFNYLLTQLFGGWDNYYSIINSSIRKLNHDIIYSIFTYTPYDFLPQQFRDDNVFIRLWLNTNQNTSIVVNSNQTYYINKIIASDDKNNNQRVKLTSYHRIDGEDNKAKTKDRSHANKQGDVYKYVWDKHGNYPLVNLSINGIRWGLWEKWVNNRKCSTGNYTNGQKQGTWYRYDHDHVSGQLSVKSVFVNNVVHGHEEEKWYSNGQLKSLGSYNMGLKYGMWKKWYDNGKLKEKGMYNKNKQCGSWKKWYDNGELESLGQYKKGKKHGLWTNFYHEGRLESKGYYNRGKKTDSWNHYERYITM